MKECDHFVFGRHGSNNMLCRLEALPLLIESEANISHFGPRPAPYEGMLRELKYFEKKDGEWLDIGTTGTAGQADPAMATLEEIDRTEDEGR